MRRLALCLATAALFVVLGGCAGEKLKERPPRAQQIVDQGQQGRAAYAKGDLPRAARLFEQALADALRIEDSEAVAVMSINLARVSRESGEPARALKVLEGVSPWHRGSIALKTAREMELLAAVLQSDLGRRELALARLAALRTQCQGACELAIGIDSLHARLTLEQGDAAGAAQLAAMAIARYRADTHPSEVANLFRVQGEARLVLGDFAAARQSLESALSIDKSLGQPGRIGQDLEALARTALAAKDKAAHAGYLARLEDVRRARAENAPR